MKDACSPVCRWARESVVSPETLFVQPQGRTAVDLHAFDKLAFQVQSEVSDIEGIRFYVDIMRNIINIILICNTQEIRCDYI